MMIYDPIVNERQPAPCKCMICGAVFTLGEPHTCKTYRVTYTDNTNSPPKRVMVNGYWYVLEVDKPAEAG